MVGIVSINKNRKKMFAIVLAMIIVALILFVHLTNNTIEPYDIHSAQTSTCILCIDEILFNMRIKEGYHKIIIIFHVTRPNITIINIYFRISKVINITPALPFKITDNGLNKLIVFIYNPAYNPLWIDNYTSYHLYLRLLDEYGFKTDLENDEPMIIYKDSNGRINKVVFSLYNYLRKYVMKYYYTEYDFEIVEWSTGAVQMIKWNVYESCTGLRVKSYSDKSIHIDLIELYIYDKHHNLLRIERYKENITLLPHSSKTIRICFKVRTSRPFVFIEKYGKVYVYAREGVVRNFEQILF